MRNIGTAAVFVLVLVGGVVAQNGSAELAARKIQEGRRAFFSAHFEAAVLPFEQAVDLDPDNPDTHLWLAAAESNLFIPGSNTPDNNRHFGVAAQQLFRAMQLRPNDLGIKRALANLYFVHRDNDPARDLLGTVISGPGATASDYYALGVIDWTEALQRRMKNNTCGAFANNAGTVSQGLRMMNKAWELRPNADEAIYMALLQEEAAALACNNAAAEAKAMAASKLWLRRAEESKKEGSKKDAQENAQSTGSEEFANDPLQTILHFQVIPPPPPGPIKFQPPKKRSTPAH